MYCIILFFDNKKKKRNLKLNPLIYPIIDSWLKLTPINISHYWLSFADTGLIIGLRPSNERRRYFVKTSLIGWAQT